jgi:hypothetical protein
MKFALGYLIVTVLTFMGLTTYWLRVKRPCDHHTGKEWSEDAIAGFGMIQALTWPVFLPLYACGMTGFLTFKVAKSWVEVAAPQQRVVLSAPKKDPYLTTGEVEVEKFLARTSNVALLESIDALEKENPSESTAVVGSSGWAPNPAQRVG